MKIWVDAQLSPALAPWITERFGVEAFSASYLGYHDATDAEIFRAAREANAVVMTKDADFVHLLDVHGPRASTAGPLGHSGERVERPNA